MTDIFSQAQVWIGLISINLTIIGLTSLAEKRSVMGVEYGKYMIDKYKILGFLRLYHVLVAVAIVNIASLFVMWSHCRTLKMVCFLLLLVSLCFTIYYFFGYVLRVHPAVKREILRNEFLGLYIRADVPCNFEADRLVGMRNGDRTQKKLSSNVISFFNTFNDDTIAAFHEIFSPDSMIYRRDRKYLRIWKKCAPGAPHDYGVYDDAGCPTGLVHISWEFFQMFRFSEIQEKWLLEILYIFNKGDYADAFPRLRLYNVARVLGQINRVGTSEGLFQYKFLDYLSAYILEALQTCGDGSEKREETERYVFRQLGIYILRNLQHNYTSTFAESAYKLLCKLVDVESFAGTVGISERLRILWDCGAAASREYQGLLKEVKKSVKRIEGVVFDFGNVLVEWSPARLYDKVITNPRRRKRFYEEVCLPEWGRRIDSGEPMEKVIEDAVAQYPGFEQEIRMYKERWFETLGESISGMAEVVERAKKKYKVYGLSNWSAETFEGAQERYPILKLVERYIISGSPDVQCVKPDEKIYRLFLDRFGIQDPSGFLFIDDMGENVEMGRKVGMLGWKFTDAVSLSALLFGPR